MIDTEITFKQAFANEIEKQIKENEKFIYLDADLMNCLGTNHLVKKHPKQAINCGIAEANMMGIAGGLSIVGYKPLVHSFAPFASRRCYDQIYLSGGYSQNDICILGSDGGICGALNGGTHQSYEDVALYRALPGSFVFDFCDVGQISLLPEIMQRKGIKYIRFYRKAGRGIYPSTYEHKIGRANVLREGKDICIVCSGILVEEALKAAVLLKEKGIHATVLDMFTIKPLDEEMILHYAKMCGHIVVAENHSKHGGLYSAVCEYLSSVFPCFIDFVAVDDRFGEVGSFSYLQEEMSLTADAIVRKAMLKRL